MAELCRCIPEVHQERMVNWFHGVKVVTKEVN